MKKQIKVIIFSVLFLCLLVSMLWGIMYVTRTKEYDWVQDKFAALPKDSAKVVFVGQSHQFCSINTNILSEEYGIESFMLATSAQTVPMSYYAAMEAIELQHPEAIVFEVAYCANDFRTVTPEMSHTFFDGMPRCKARKEALEDLIGPEDSIYYLLNFGVYHSRWKELQERDFLPVKTDARGNYFSEDQMYNWEIPVANPKETEDIPEEMAKYLEKMAALCEENQVQLIWYCAPFNGLYNEDGYREDLLRRERIFNQVGIMAKAHNIPYYNLFYELDEIGLDGETDWKDSQHLNCYGQEKLTRYMAEKGYFNY